MDGCAFRRGSVAAGPDEPGLVGEDDELLGDLLVGESERARPTSETSAVRVPSLVGIEVDPHAQQLRAHRPYGGGVEA
jgi:hypothetical protein